MLVAYRPGEIWPDHEHEQFSISVVLSGQLTESVGSCEERAALGSCVLKPAGSVHSNRFGPGGATFLAMWPGELVTRNLLRGASIGWRWRHETKQIRKWVLIAQELRQGDRSGIVEEEVIGLINAEGVAPLYPEEPPARLRFIRDCLHALNGARPSVASLAEAIGLHPVYLARSFRAHYGCSITDYVRRLRIQKAATMVLNRGGPPMAAIAQELGFADQSHFCRAFSAELGVSPSAYRRAIGQP